MQISSKLRRGEGHLLSFWCPGCRGVHAVRVNASPPPGWGWNGDVTAPTFSPSILVASGHYAPGWQGPECWCNFKERTGREPDFKCSCCHSFVTAGRIQFLCDSTHDLSGQTVDLPDLPEHLRDNDRTGRTPET